jgi:hypothetical protein
MMILLLLLLVLQQLLRKSLIGLRLQFSLRHGRLQKHSPLLLGTC